jgi:2-oxoglutarate ferredoxin oxidoreductase subunit delta
MAEVRIQKDKCKSCGLCILYCPSKCLEFSLDLNKRGLKYAKKKKDKDCIGCGACFLICPDFCIEIYEKKLQSHKATKSQVTK